MSARLNRRGATLPLSILVIALLGVSVAIAYARLSSERRITGDAQAQMNAFAVAQSGLARFLANLNAKPAPPPGGNMDVTYNDLPGGTALVSLRMLRDSTITLLPAVYVITSRGTNTTAKRYSASAAPAERTVATYALWVPAPFDLNAAITSLGGMDKAGGSGAMDGNDACGVAPAIPGVAVTTGAGVSGTSYTGSASPIDGNPDNTPISLGTPGGAGTAKDQVGIDWAGIVAGTVLPPDFVYPAWPGSFANWPVVRVNNDGGADFDLTGNGKGILIVTGNLNINGSNSWEGVILVGGWVRSNGSNDVHGAVIAGLNVKLGQVVGPSTMNGTKSYRYDSCALSRALGHIGSIQPVRNGWTDTWPSY
jgi:hypothetical protein